MERSSMYRLGRRSKKHRKKYVWILILFILLTVVGIAAFFLLRLVAQDVPEPTTPQAITRQYAPPESENTKEFEQDPFLVTLPSDWRFVGHNTEPHNIYKFQASKKNADNRWLEVYIDQVPNKALNRLMPIMVEDNKITVVGSVSENCTAFTGTQQANQQNATGILPAKWQGIEFLCDIGNNTRNLVGTGTIGTNTNIKLATPAGAQRTIQFVYIDHNIRPDYQIFEDALASFSLK